MALEVLTCIGKYFKNLVLFQSSHAYFCFVLFKFAHHLTFYCVFEIMKIQYCFKIPLNSSEVVK